LPADFLGRRALLFGVIALAGCAVDLVSKSWAFGRLGNLEVLPFHHRPIWLVPEIFGFETSLNEGALFGMGQGQVVLFSVLSVIALVGIVYWLFFAGAARDRLLTTALGCVSGGILGNLYDRTGMPGLRWTALVDPRRGHEPGEPVYAVRDWLHFKVDALNFDWPIFNIADSLLVCGALLLLYHALFTREPAAAEKTVDEKPT
jgi:signal peptidase II